MDPMGLKSVLVVIVGDDEAVVKLPLKLQQ